MTTLHAIVALRKGLQSRTEVAVTKIYQQGFQKSALYAGQSRVYTPTDDNGERFPNESQLVQREVAADLKTLAGHLTQLFDVIYTVDVANTTALGTVTVDGTELVTAPTPFLLFLLKQAQDLRTMISKVPTLDPSEVWQPDAGVGGWRTQPTLTSKTKRALKVLVKYEATDKHPAQTETYNQDDLVGTWATTRFSGALPPAERDRLLGRVDQLIDAVKVAIAAANTTEVEQQHCGARIFDWLLESY
jgi:hypothetical protein